MSIPAELRDHAAARGLAWIGLAYVASWAVFGAVYGAIRFQDLMASRQTWVDGRSWDSLFPLGVEFALFPLHLLSFGALAAGIVIGVTSLVFSGRPVRGGLLLVLAFLGGLAHWLEWLREDRYGRPFGNGFDTALLGPLAGAVGPVIVLVVVAVLLAPALGTTRVTAYEPHP